MQIKAKNCSDMVNHAIKSINDTIKFARENDFTTEQVETLNTGNIVTILGAIAQSLAVIADNLERIAANSDPELKEVKDNGKGI